MDNPQPQFDLSKLASAKGAKAFQGEAAAGRKRRRLDWRTWTPLSLVLLGTAALSGTYLMPLLEPVHEVTVQPVVIEQDVEQRRTTTALRASGWVEPNPYPTRINAQVMGVVQDVFVVEGDPLVAGETVVAQLDTTLIEREIAVTRAHIEYDRKKVAEMEAQIARLETLKERNLDARLRVARLERDLATLQRAQREAQAALDSALAQREQNAELRMSYVHHKESLANAEEALRRFEQEYRMTRARLPYLAKRAEALRANAGEDLVTELQVLEAETAYEEAKAKLDGFEQRRESMLAKIDAARDTYRIAKELVDAPEMLDTAVRKARATAESIPPQIASLQGELQVAREDVEQPLGYRTDIAVMHAGIERLEYEIKEAQAMLATQEERKRLHTVVATVDGEVLEVPTEPGSMIGTLSEAMSIVTAFDPQRIQVRVYLPFGDVPAVEPGQRVEITSEAAPGRTYEGVVTRFVRRANLARNALEVKVEVKNPDGRLKPDMLTVCRFLPVVRERDEEESDQRQVLRFFVPRAAIVGTSAGDAVYVYDPRGFVQGEGVAQLVQVTAHEDAVAPEGHVEVEGTLQRGQRVIVSPPQSLGNGSRVRRQ